MPPIFEYECNDCSHKFEKLIRGQDPPPKCPKCGCERLQQMISTGHFNLKGEGFYKRGMS